MSSEPSPLRELDPTEDPGAILRWMIEASKHVSSVILWTKGQAEATRTHFTVLSQVDQAFYTWMPKDFDLEKFLEEVRKQQGECIVTISLPTAQIFFKTKFIIHDSSGLKFRVPNLVYKIQRRKDARFKIPASHVLKIQYQDPLFPDVVQQKKVIDISAGGLAFATAEVDLPIYPIGLNLSQLNFVIHQKKCLTDAEVRHTKPIHEPRNSIKVGVLFKTLPNAEQNLIASYVLEESTKYFAKFLV